VFLLLTTQIVIFFYILYFMQYAILRRHLSKDCPEFVPGLILPRLKGILNHAKVLTCLTVNSEPRNRRQWLSVQKPLATLLCLMTILTFKVKAMRGMIASTKPVQSILNISSLCSHPHVLAMLIKLHVNIEGGYGTTWRSQHKKAVLMIRSKLEDLANVDANIDITDTERKRMAVQNFSAAMHSHLIPFNRKSRAYSDLAFAWRVRDVCKPGETLGEFHGGGRGYVGESTGGQEPILHVLAKKHQTFSNNTNMGEGNRGGSSVGTGVGSSGGSSGGSSSGGSSSGGSSSGGSSSGGSSPGARNNTSNIESLQPPPSLSFQLSSPSSSSSRMQTNSTMVTATTPIKTANAGDSGHGFEKKYDAAISNRHSSSMKEDFEVRSKTKAFNDDDKINTKELMELDELDGILLGLDRGPPPPRFLCGLTGCIISDPLKHPRHQVWVDRSALEDWVSQAFENKLDENGKVRWPGQPTEPFLPEDIDSIVTDQQMAQDIIKWQVRKRI
jgi:hypothetical protein